MLLNPNQGLAQLYTPYAGNTYSLIRFDVYLQQDVFVRDFEL